MTETIVAAACRFGPLTLSMEPPARHHSVMHAMIILGSSGRIPPADTGFLTSKGRFVGRAAAARIALAAGQVSELIAGPDLYSEDLW